MNKRSWIKWLMFVFCLFLILYLNLQDAETSMELSNTAMVIAATVSPIKKTCRPGITGLWQVSGRSDLDYDARVPLDAVYIKNRSFWGDIVILWKTIGVVLMKKGAY